MGNRIAGRELDVQDIHFQDEQEQSGKNDFLQSLKITWRGIDVNGSLWRSIETSNGLRN